MATRVRYLVAFYCNAGVVRILHFDEFGDYKTILEDKQ